MRFNALTILEGAGKISHKDMEIVVKGEIEKFRKISRLQDRDAIPEIESPRRGKNYIQR